MDDPVMPKEEEEMKAVEALSRAMLGSFRNLHMQIQVIHVIQFSHVFPCCFSFTKWKAVIRNINTNLNELLAKSVLYKAGWILLDSVSCPICPPFHPSLIPQRFPEEQHEKVMQQRSQCPGKSWKMRKLDCKGKEN